MNEVETSVTNEKEEELSNEQYQEIVSTWMDGIKNNSLPVESILVLERLFRFLINDYGPNIIGAICQNEIVMFNQLMGQSEQEEE